MVPKEVEVILARHFASCLAMPTFIVDPVGTLLYYNESAEGILGRRFEETGEMTFLEWAGAFDPVDHAGAPMTAEELPLARVLAEKKPVHRRIQIRNFDGVRRSIEVTAFPLIGQANRFLGALSIFWEHQI